MLITILNNLIKILIFAAILALEVSVAIPIVSVLYLLLVTHVERSISKVFLLVVASLIMSSFINVSWSLVTLLFGLTWFATAAVAQTKLHIQNAAFLASLTLAIVLASLSHLTLNYKTMTYTVVFVIASVLISRVFLPRKLRHTVIDWISLGRAR